jgi:hypothetical protein
MEERDRPTVIDVVVTRDPAQMLPAVDNRTVEIKRGSGRFFVMRPIADRAAEAFDRPARVSVLPLRGYSHALHLTGRYANERPFERYGDVAGASGERTDQERQIDRHSNLH